MLQQENRKTHMKDFKTQFRNRKFVTKKIGHVGVDAGMIMIGDPCYTVGLALSPTEKEIDFCRKIYGKDWFEFVDRFCGDKGDLKAMNDYGFAFCTSTVNGDGFYNVYGLYDDETTQPKYLIVEL